MAQRRIPDGPLVQVTLAPKSGADRDRLAAALASMAVLDPSLTYVREGIGQMSLGGVSEAHLDHAIHVLRNDQGFDLKVGAPEIGYRERVLRPIEIDHTHKRQSGGGGVFARVLIRFEPGEPGSRFAFENLAGTAVPQPFVDAVRTRLEKSRRHGVLAGFPMIELKATLADGAYHELDSTTAAFEAAARDAFGMLADRRAVDLLEPIMAITIETPDEAVGGIIGDLNARRGQVLGLEARGNVQLVNALAPLSCLFGHQNAVMSLTRGRGCVTLQFDSYQPVPRTIDDGPDRFPPAAAMRA
jgi:elongation factor G